ncbi:MAG: tetratricopeptide repeat protein [Deltaproteobacteria bacterium]|nr:tetratricopeptide repeat protein [Deltaproteobacteria bacterium]
MKHIFAIIIALFLLLPSLAFAEFKTFEKEYIYQASEIDSKVTSRAIAVEQVKRLVLEELGVYLMAETEVRDFQITKDRVVMLTAGIVQTEILNEKWDGERYFLKARIKADPKDVAASLDVLRKDVQKSKELEDVQKRADEAFKEIEKLKSELEAVKADKNKQPPTPPLLRGIQEQYAKAADTLSAADWHKKGYQHALNKEYDDAIETFTKAIALDPNLAQAYRNRGVAYDKKGHLDKAIEDLSKAIILNSNDAAFYANRGTIYNKKGYSDMAIEDFNKAIALDPNLALAYNNRGFAYYNKGQYDMAIEDYNKAIVLNPNFANAYTGRGIAYALKRNMGRAISDFQKACDMGHELGCEKLQGALGKR